MPTPGPGEALVKVAYAALNPLDNHARADRIKWNHPGYPFTPGFEFCGMIDAVGEGVDASLIGQRVATNGQWGGNAEFAAVNTTSLVSVPPDFDWKLASCFSTCAYTAWLLVHSAAPRSKRTSGSSSIQRRRRRSLVIQIAKFGRPGHWSGGRRAGVRVRRTICPDAVIDYLRDDWPDGASTGRGADVIFDGNAGDRAPMNLDAVAPLGHHLPRRECRAAPRCASCSLASCSMSGFVQYFHQAISGGAKWRQRTRRSRMANWRIPIEREFDLADIAEVHRAWEARELLGRAVIRVGGEL